MLSCRDLTEKASDYLDGRLPLGTRLSLRLHLFLCVHCRRYLRQMRLTLAALARRRPPEPPPPDVETLLRKAAAKD